MNKWVRELIVGAIIVGLLLLIFGPSALVIISISALGAFKYLSEKTLGVTLFNINGSAGFQSNSNLSISSMKYSADDSYSNVVNFSSGTFSDTEYPTKNIPYSLWSELRYSHSYLNLPGNIYHLSR